MVIYNMYLYQLKDEANSIILDENIDPVFITEFNRAIKKIMLVKDPIFHQEVENFLNLFLKTHSKMAFIILVDKMGPQFLDIYPSVIVILSIYLALAQISPHIYKNFIDELLKDDIYSIFKEEANEMLQNQFGPKLMIEYHKIYSTSKSKEELHNRTLRLFSALKNIKPHFFLNNCDDLQVIYNFIKEKMLEINKQARFTFIKKDFENLNIILKLNLLDNERKEKIINHILEIDNDSALIIDFIKNVLKYLETENNSLKLILYRKKED